MAKGTTIDRAAAPPDAGLVEIGAWHDWFVAAHRQRLTELDLPRAQHDGELAAVLVLADAVRQRMIDDYQARPR